MPVRPRPRICAGLAGGIALALTLHVLMLAGVGTAHQSQPAAADTTDVPGVAAAVTTLRALPDAPDSDGHGHVVAGCMAMLAVLALGLLLAAARRPLAAAGAMRATAPPPRRRPRIAHAGLPPGPLVAQAILLRV